MYCYDEIIGSMQTIGLGPKGRCWSDMHCKSRADYPDSGLKSQKISHIEVFCIIMILFLARMWF